MAMFPGLGAPMPAATGMYGLGGTSIPWAEQAVQSTGALNNVGGGIWGGNTGNGWADVLQGLAKGMQQSGGTPPDLQLPQAFSPSYSRGQVRLPAPLARSAAAGIRT